MKPLLIFPPAPARWLAIEEILAHEPAPWLADLQARFATAQSSEDALALIPGGSRALAIACIRRKGDVGVLGHLFTRPDHRGRGFARRLMQTLLSWFDMTRGRRLYVTAPEELHGRFLEHFGFQIQAAAGGRAALVRELAGAASAQSASAPGVREMSRAEWPQMVDLLRTRPDADPRVRPPESVVSAEEAGMQLLTEQERGATRLLGAWNESGLDALASVAIDTMGRRTLAMILPRDNPPALLRSVVEELARGKGYEQVDYPLELM